MANDKGQTATPVEQLFDTPMPDGTVKRLTWSQLQEHLKSLTAATAAAEEATKQAFLAQKKAEAEAEEARKANERTTEFRISMARYSTTNDDVSKRGKLKGTFQINSMGSRFPIVFSIDQWQQIHEPANLAKVEAFIAEHKSELVTMASLLGK